MDRENDRERYRDVDSGASPRLSPLEKQLADLRWRQNTLIPIARVLPELLVDVFELVMDAVDLFERDDTNLILVVLTRICSDWTRLISNTPCLWSRISPKISPFKHVAVALTKSKPGPLDVHFRAWQVSQIGPGHFLGAIKKHADRLKILDLELDHPRSVDALNALFAKVLPPRLETLRVSLRIGGSAATWPELSFFKGPWHDTLQHLQLEGVRLPPGGYGELRGLRSLLLTPTISPFLLKTTEILRALSNCPNLENLSINSLTEAEGELTVGTGNRMTPVRLDRLRRITLRLPPASLRAVLGSIRPTKLDHVEIETTMPRENKLAWTDVLLTNDIQPFVQVMNSLLQSTSEITIHVDGPKVALWTPSTYKTPYGSGSAR
ncbi:hypothetical protein FRC00_001392 [Tulasnella sp. 408]|nr:hypothetical protein FRC00_001392 [Tulasnella sp. 408]